VRARAFEHRGTSIVVGEPAQRRARGGRVLRILAEREGHEADRVCLGEARERAVGDRTQARLLEAAREVNRDLGRVDERGGADHRGLHGEAREEARHRALTETREQVLGGGGLEGRGERRQRPHRLEHVVARVQRDRRVVAIEERDLARAPHVLARVLDVRRDHRGLHRVVDALGVLEPLRLRRRIEHHARRARRYAEAGDRGHARPFAFLPPRGAREHPRPPLARDLAARARAGARRRSHVARGARRRQALREQLGDQRVEIVERCTRDVGVAAHQGLEERDAPRGRLALVGQRGREHAHRDRGEALEVLVRDRPEDLVVELLEHQLGRASVVEARDHLRDVEQRRSREAPGLLRLVGPQEDRREPPEHGVSMREGRVRCEATELLDAPLGDRIREGRLGELRIAHRSQQRVAADRSAVEAGGPLLGAVIEPRPRGLVGPGTLLGEEVRERAVAEHVVLAAQARGPIACLGPRGLGRARELRAEDLEAVDAARHREVARRGERLGAARRDAEVGRVRLQREQRGVDGERVSVREPERDEDLGLDPARLEREATEAREAGHVGHERRVARAREARGVEAIDERHRGLLPARALARGRRRGRGLAEERRQRAARARERRARRVEPRAQGLRDRVGRDRQRLLLGPAAERRAHLLERSRVEHGAWCPTSGPRCEGGGERV
jgi:hypothetical protein